MRWIGRIDEAMVINRLAMMTRTPPKAEWANQKRKTKKKNKPK